MFKDLTNGLVCAFNLAKLSLPFFLFFGKNMSRLQLLPAAKIGIGPTDSRYDCK